MAERRTAAAYAQSAWTSRTAAGPHPPCRPSLSLQPHLMRLLQRTQLHSSAAARRLCLPGMMLAAAPAVTMAAMPAQPAQQSAVPPSQSETPQPQLHTTDWKDVNVGKFIGLTVFFSTVENALFYPFYVIKTREQADRATGRLPAAAGGVAGKAEAPWATSMRHLRTLLAEQGVRKGLFGGFWASNITAFPAYAVYMGVYTATKNELGYSGSGKHDGQFHLSNLYAPLLAGLIADAASVALYVPGDIVVQRLQLKDSPYTGFFDACRQIWRTDGLKGFFRGFGATFFTSGVASSMWWMIYENTKAKLYAGEDAAAAAQAHLAVVKRATGAGSSEDVPAAAAPAAAAPRTLWGDLTAVNRLPQIGAGFIAGTLTSVTVNPFDVVKTRLQVQDAAVKAGSAASAATVAASAAATGASVEAATAAGAAAAPVRYKNLIHGLYRIWIDEGVRGYTRGLAPKLASRGLLSACSGLLYEVVLAMSRKETDTPAHKSSFAQ